MSEPMTEARLVDVEADMRSEPQFDVYCRPVVTELIAEVRRLRVIESAASGVCAADDNTWTESDQQNFFEDLRAALNKP